MALTTPKSYLAQTGNIKLGVTWESPEEVTSRGFLIMLTIWVFDGVCKKEEACFLADALPFVQAMKYTITVLLSQIHKNFRTAKGVPDKD